MTNEKHQSVLAWVAVGLTGLGMAGTILLLAFNVGERIAIIEIKLSRLENDVSAIMERRVRHE